MFKTLFGGQDKGETDSVIGVNHFGYWKRCHKLKTVCLCPYCQLRKISSLGNTHLLNQCLQTRLVYSFSLYESALYIYICAKGFVTNA